MTDYQTDLIGVDISKWQEDFNPETAKARGVRFVYIKAMENGVIDPFVLAHWGKVKNSGLAYGFYFYYREGPGALTPTDQAVKFHEFLETIGDFGTLPPAVDVEETNNPTLTAGKVKVCVETVHALFQRLPAIYTRASIWNPKIGAAAWAAIYYLWVAHYPFTKWRGDSHFADVIALHEESPEDWPFSPLPWKKAKKKPLIWQIGLGPGAEFGVPSPLIDLDLGSDLLEPMLPPIQPQPEPEPEPEPEPQPEPGVFMAKFTVRKDLPNTSLNVRNNAKITGEIVGSLPEGTNFDALAVRAADPLTLTSIWLLIHRKNPSDPNDSDQWVAWKHAGVVYCLEIT